MAVVLDPVTVYSSGIVVSAGDTSYAEVLEAGGNDLISATSGGVVAETSMGAGTLLVAESGAIVSGININDEGAVFSGTEVYCSGAEKWYGPAACATFGSIVLVGGTFTGNVASASGGLLGQGGALEGYEGFISVSGGVYDANSATGGGGAILGIGGRTEITDAEFTANSATYGGAVEISQDGGTAQISGGAFTGNSAGYGGAFEVHQGASAYISGAEFMGNQAGSGGAVMVDAYAAQKSYLTLVNATFTKNVAEYGGAVLNDGVLVVSGGEFVANTAEDGRGGALYNNLGTATVSGANFAANMAIYGGAIWQGTRKLTLNDVVLDGNSAIYGGALYANGSGATTIKNASFSGNSAYYDEDYDLGGMGGALYVTAAATVTVTDTIFGDNVAVVNPDNEWDGGCGGAVINYGNLTVTGGEFSGNSAYYGAGLYNQAGAGTPMTVTNANFLNNSATYGGAGICNCWGELVVSGGTYSGNTVEFRDGAGIANWSDATITDAIFMENVAVKGGAIGHTGTTLTVDGAVFGENGATEEGGAIWIMNEWGDSVATLVNCSYTENTAEAGGAIWNGEELTVSGGEFSGNAASDGKGGALYNSGAAVVSGANFVDNTAIYGGAIWHGGETLELADAYVADNTAIYGAALYANGSGATVISAASFEGNRAYYDEDYDLGGMGGALYVTAAATVTVTDTIFDGNVAEVNPDNEWDGGCGGAVINYGNLTVSGGAFNANSAYYGAGLYNQAGAGTPMTVADADFANNSATYGGGAICNCWGELVVSGGTFTSNTVERSDGGAIANWSVATVTDATFTANTAATGGAISNSWSESITIDGALFTGNTATQGGAFWQNSGTATISNTTFTGNTAEAGGAIWNSAEITLDNCTFATASDTIWNSGTITVTGATTFSAEVTNTDDGVFAVALGDAGDPALVNGWSNLAGGTISIIAPDAMTLDAAYRVATGVGDWSGAVALAVGAIEVPGAFEIRDGVVSSGTVLCNGVAYVLGAGDDALALSAEEVEVQSEAKPFSGGGATTLVNGDLAAEWGVGTQCPDGVTLADDTLTGNVLLEIDGTEVGGALFGAAGNYVGTVNIEAKSGTIRNLAAGAEANGSVAGVKLLLAEADVAGVAYAGGFGNVAGETETQIDGGTFAKDFYAGALANYKKTGTVTNTGDIRFTIDGGEFSGNVYGASAVKAGSATTTVHTAGDVTLKLAGGSTAKDDFCCFAGGYATGSAESTTAVYTVGDIDVEISGGSWGKAHGGRGIFGGVFASKVTAEAQDVSITISGGTLGNVYGGGWAQKGGKSIVGDVSITITDGTLANVFGGGSTSTSGGSTSAKNVTITVSGGNITGAIYAKGQTEYDLVASAVVTFTGAADYGCGVYGYDHVDGAASNAALTFNAYTGSFSGDIGGFASVKFAGGTAMTLGTAAADVSNTAWTFDIAERSETLAGTALLDWAAADFAGDTIALDPGTTTPTEWTLIAAASTTAYGTFDVEGIATGLVLDQQIADTGTAWDGWGFTLDESTLKFKHLA